MPSSLMLMFCNNYYAEISGIFSFTQLYFAKGDQIANRAVEKQMTSATRLIAFPGNKSII